MTLPWRSDYNALAYVMAGRGTVGDPGASRAGGSGGSSYGFGSDAVAVETGQLTVFGPGNALTISALPLGKQEMRSPNLDVLILGGRPIGEPVAWMGPFVMNTREELMQAVSDYQAGRLGSIPAIHGAPTTIQER